MTTKRKVLLAILALIALVFVAYSLESAWYNHMVQLNFEIITDSDLHGGIPIACDNAEFAALAQEFIKLESLAEQEDFINRLAQPIYDGLYIFCRETLMGIQRHVDATILEITEAQMPLSITDPYFTYLNDQRRCMMRRSVLLMIVSRLSNENAQVFVGGETGPVDLAIYHRERWGEVTAFSASTATISGTPPRPAGNIQNHEMHIRRMGIAMEIRVGEIISSLDENMPERQLVRFDEILHNFIMDKWRLSGYFRYLYIEDMSVIKVNEDSGLKHNWQMRLWTSSHTQTALNEFNTVAEAEYTLMDFLYDPMIGRESFDNLDSRQINLLLDMLRQQGLW